MIKQMYDLSPLLDTLLEKEKIFPYDEDTKEYSQYLTLLLNALKNRVNNPIFLLTPDNVVSNLYNYLKEIDNYLNTKNINNWHNIYNNSKAITTILVQVPYDSGNSTKQNFRSIVSNFEKQTDNIVKNLSSKVEELNKSNDQLDKELKDLNTRISQKETEITNLTTKYQDQFSDAQETRINEYNELVKHQSETFDAKLKELEKTSDEIIQVLQERNEKSLSLVGKLSARVFGDYYSGSANKAKWFAHVLFTVVLIYLTCCSYYIYNLIIKTPQFDWKVLFYKTMALLPIYIPAIYLICEVNRQRRKEEKYQDLGMKIQTSTPYMDSIANDLKQNQESTKDFNKLRLELARKFFTEQYKIENKSKKWISQKEMISFVKDLLEIYKNKKD